VEGTLARNDAGRLRIDHLDVVLHPRVEGERTGRYERCLDIFEDFCIVTQSVRAGIQVDVRVEPTFADEESSPARAGAVSD
jgi:organic hydroperoxide reductase OsmC/OhrA